MKNNEFRKFAHQTVDWVADYLENIEKFPVKSPVEPGEVFDQLPDSAPQAGEDFELMMSDLKKIILPGITHWQHPNFHAFFPGNSSYPSVLAEILTAGLATQCMMWDTSPAAAELEEKMMEWLKPLMGLPPQWLGVIQDTASSSTLCALLSARESKTAFQVNEEGYRSIDRLRIYCSRETHSSIEKGAKIAGFGRKNVVKVEVDEHMAMRSEALEKAIKSDLRNGYIPCCIVATLGTTGTLAFDPVEEIARVSQTYKCWLHVDAAYAGSAMILPEFHWMNKGLPQADSFVFDPHKWLFTNFDCSVYFVRDKDLLLKTFEITPEYLKTKINGRINNYKDWGIPLGRRFRALKLWMVIRSFGVHGLQNTLRNQIKWTEWLEAQINKHTHLELLAPRIMNLVVFRYHQAHEGVNENRLNKLNAQILSTINQSGQAYLSHTLVGNKYGLRLVVGQTTIEFRHVKKVWALIIKTITSLQAGN